MSIEQRYFPIDLQPDVAVGIKIPWTRLDGVLFNQSYSTIDQLLSNVKNLILTRQGERVMQPLFGTNLQDSLFEQNTEDLRNSIRNSISRAIEFWLPYVSIDRLDVEPVIAILGTDEEHGVKVVLYISLNGQQAEQPITFLVTPSGVELI